jgi:multicomponent Na+:H+ antiporter subunit B
VVVVLGRSRNLFSVVVLGGVYSFMMATVLVAMDAVDVAMTEASVGAGVSTVLFLGALYLCDSEEAKPIRHPALPAAVSLAVGALLVYGSMGLPMFDDDQAPIHRHQGNRRAQRRHRRAGQLPRLRHAGRDHGGLHGRGRRGGAAAPTPPQQEQGGQGMKNDLILRVVAKLLMPYILLFALYVQFHGDFGPGGGFQAGVIIAATMLFYGLIYGLPAAQKVVPEPLVEAMMALGVLIYGGVGVAGLLLGGNYLDYFVLAHDSVHGQERGIFWVEIGVAITVSGVMLKIFYMFADRRKGEFS